MILINTQNLNNPIMPAFIPLTVEVQEDGVAEGQVNTLNFTTNLDVSVSGNVATVSATGVGSSLFPTTGTGTATGAVVGDLDGNDLTIADGGAIAETATSFTRTADTHTFNAGGETNLSVSTQTSLLRGFDPTDNDNVAIVVVNANSTQVNSSLAVDFNGGSKVASIQQNADASSSSITHTAGEHIFDVNMGSPALALSDLVSVLRNFDNTGNGNEGTFEAESDGSEGKATVKANFNDGVEIATIVAVANATTSSITHTADQHTINGLVDIAGATDIVGNSTITGTLTMTGAVKTSANNTDDIGDSTNSFKDIYARTVKLDGSTSGTVTVNSDALSNALNTTTLSGTGYGGGTMFSRLTGNFTMSDVNTVQPVFGTGQDVWTLQGATTYRMKGQYYLTHGATSHSVGMSFELGGGASVTAISYSVVAWVTAKGTVTATQATTLVGVTTNTAINFAGANAQEVITFEGWLTMNAGGTVTPSITFSAAPGGAPVAVAYDTWIEFTPIATNTATQLGNVA